MCVVLIVVVPSVGTVLFMAGTFFGLALSWTSTDASSANVLYQQMKKKKTVCFLTILSSGRMVTSLVREFLQFFDLEYTLTVFEPEIGFVSIFARSLFCARNVFLSTSVMSFDEQAKTLLVSQPSVARFTSV